MCSVLFYSRKLKVMDPKTESFFVMFERFPMALCLLHQCGPEEGHGGDRGDRVHGRRSGDEGHWRRGGCSRWFKQDTSHSSAAARHIWVGHLLKNIYSYCLWIDMWRATSHKYFPNALVFNSVKLRQKYGPNELVKVKSGKEKLPKIVQGGNNIRQYLFWYTLTVFSFGDWPSGVSWGVHLKTEGKTKLSSIILL